jgi:hypothetical protein
LIDTDGTPILRLDPALTGGEAIVLRSLVAGQTQRHVRKELRMSPAAFLGMMRDLREKIGTADDVSLIVWAKRKITDADQRIDRPERYSRPG